MWYVEEGRVSWLEWNRRRKNVFADAYDPQQTETVEAIRLQIWVHQLTSLHLPSYSLFDQRYIILGSQTVREP